jgi:YVTN family beta-propeller protein
MRAGNNMKFSNLFYLFAFVVTVAPLQTLQADTPYLHAPSVTTYATFNPDGLTILPDGRFLRPVGAHFPVAKWPNGIVLSPDESTLFVSSAHVGQFITDWDSGNPVVTAIVPDPDNVTGDRAYGGASVFSPDGKLLYWSSGNSGAVYVVDVKSAKVLQTISLNCQTDGKTFDGSEVMDLQLSADGRYLYCADVTNFRLAIISTASDQVISSIPSGRAPYSIAVAGSKVFMANVGLFEYKPIPAPTDGKSDQRGLTFPPFGYPSNEARDGVVDEGRTIPGLGDPNTPESFSVWGFDVSRPVEPSVVMRLKTGLLVGQPSDGGETVGGSAPNYLVASNRVLYVSNNNNDMISRVDLATGKIIGQTRIIPSPLTAKLRGVCPAGMALSPDGRRLYICEMGLNAIGVMDTSKGKMIGHIPTAWYPYRIVLTHDGRKLLVVCFRGFGNGPKGVAMNPDSIYRGFEGTYQVIDRPSDNALTSMTQNVLKYNGLVDRSADRKSMSSPIIPGIVGKSSSEIKYVVFIDKENHSFDTIFDRVPGAISDPKLLRWGLHQRIAEDGEPTLSDAAVMVNHNALARQFLVSDNFYVQPEASGVGHRWLVGVQPNNWCQMTYTLRWDFDLNSNAPGRLQSFGGNASIAPEDYPEAGSMWNHLGRYNIPFRNYGEGFEFAGVDEDRGEEKSGAREEVNIPMPKILYDNTCRDFPNFNMNIPDQYRAKWFIQDFESRFLNGKYPMPRFINIALCNDHGSDPDPEHGYPYVASWMADDDLALGRIVAFLSHTKYWKNMAILVTQDDAGSENDHIDGQRSVMLLISPWVRHGTVSHRHTTILSMHRTLYEILGLPPLNMFDALANDFSDCFTDQPDFTPYNYLPVDARIFDPRKAIDPKDPNYLEARERPSIQMDDPDVVAKVAASGE